MCHSVGHADAWQERLVGAQDFSDPNLGSWKRRRFRGGRNIEWNELGDGDVRRLEMGL